MIVILIKKIKARNPKKLGEIEINYAVALRKSRLLCCIKRKAGYSGSAFYKIVH